MVSYSGYMSPEYAIDGRFSVKSDVFNLGVLMLEIVSGMKNRKFFHLDHHHNLVGHVSGNFSLSLSLSLSPLENYVSICIVIAPGMVVVEGGQGLGTIVYMFGGFTFKISNLEMHSSCFTMCSKVP